MGYESKLYVVRKTKLQVEYGERKMVFGEVVAMFDLCKVYKVSDKIRKYPATDCIIYQGDIEMVKDSYDEPLREIPIQDAIEILESAAEQEHYRRYAPCIQMLKGFDLSEWSDLVVLHFGY